MLVSLMVDEFLTERSVKLSPTSRLKYDNEMSRFVRYLEDRGVTDTAQLTLPVLVEYMTWLRDTPTHGTLRASKTLVGYHKTMKCLLSWAVDAEYLGSRVLKVPAPRLEKKIPSTLTHDDALTLVRAARESRGGALQARDTAIALTLLDTGIRASELVNLSLSDVNLDEGFILVRHGKNDKWRQVGPLGARSLRALRSYKTTWRQKLHPHCDTFFLSRDGGTMSRFTLGHLTQRLKARSGVESRANPHSYRHAYARSLAEAGAPTHVISRLLGHSSIAVTQGYLASFSSVDARKQVQSVVDGL